MALLLGLVTRGRFLLAWSCRADLTGPRWYRLDVPGGPTSATLPVGIIRATH